MPVRDPRDALLAPYPMPSIDPTSSPMSSERLVLSALPDAVLVLDPLGVVREVNPAAERLFGRTAESLRNAPVDRLLATPDGSPGANGLAAWLRTTRLAAVQRWTGCRGRLADGSDFACDVSLATISGAGAPGRWVLTVQETGSREFQTTQRRESAKMAAIATLAAGIANDFNNALAAITGSIEAARLRIVSQDRVPPRELLEAKEATRGAARLVRRLLNFARPSPGTRRTIEPGLVIEEAAQVLRRDLDPRITLVTRLDHGDWRLHADMEQLTDLLVSLGHNAIEAMPARRGPHPEHRPNRGRLGRRRAGGPGWTRVPPHRSERHRHRHPGRDPAADLRALLHHQGGRPRRGTRPRDRLRGPAPA